jgi:peptide/nickel transport system ATP-binding protein
VSAALTVERLGVDAVRDGAVRPILSEVSFTLAAGSSVGLVGASGAGKSTVGNALLGLLPAGLRIHPGSHARIGADDLFAMRTEQLRATRGRRLAMVFQEPLLALDPAMRVGRQLEGALEAHGLARDAEARERAVAMLAKVGLGDARSAAERHPHELSGGMRQRVLLALALLLEPDVLVADEPTTALDATMQAQLLDLLEALRAESGTALLLISHDLPLVAERCERVLAIEGGRIVADGSAREMLARRTVPPAARRAHPAERAVPMLTARDVSVHFAAPRGLRPRVSGVVRAVDDVSLDLARGECLGLIGESGCGKSTFARAIAGLQPLTSGAVALDGVTIGAETGAALMARRRRVQLVPQDAGAALTPHCTVLELVREGIDVHALASGAEADRRALRSLADVGLDASFAHRLARELSSGERQRAAIARAIAVEPEVLICDEPAANVDPVLREQLLALLDRLRDERGLALLLISHDLDAVRRLASRVCVMYLGRIVERSESPAALDTPLHPYTNALRAAFPTGDPTARARRIVLRGELPSPLHPPAGCAFHPRCPHPARDASCQVSRPPLAEVAPGRHVACTKIGL